MAQKMRIDGTGSIKWALTASCTGERIKSYLNEGIHGKRKDRNIETPGVHFPPM